MEEREGDRGGDRQSEGGREGGVSEEGGEEGGKAGGGKEGERGVTTASALHVRMPFSAEGYKALRVKSIRPN